MFSRLPERIKYLFFEVMNDWQIGISVSSIQSFLTNDEIPRIKWLAQPKDVIWADPFGIQRDDKYYIFYEEYHKVKEYATINCMVLDANLEEIDRKVIIDEGTHSSFPLVFAYSGQYYMLPETFAAGKLVLYIAANFPYEWKQHKVLLNIPCVDGIVFFRDSHWWLLYCKSTAKDGNSLFFIRKSVDLFGDWEQCPEHTFHNGPYNSRPAGEVFEHNKELYRVTQNCTDSYGQSIVINKIIDLSDTGYKEEAVKEMAFNVPGVSGFHTLSSCGDLSLVDRRKERLFLRTPGKILESISNKLRGIKPPEDEIDESL